MTVYADTSAIVKLVVLEHESSAMQRYLSTLPVAPITSFLTYTELYCAIARRGVPLVSKADEVLAEFDLVDLIRSDFLHAANNHWGLRSHDALHLAVAIRLRSTHMLTYDKELADAAARVGLDVVMPR